MVHAMKLDPKPFYKIKKGLKTIELRLNDEKRQKISIGDTIEFLNLKNGKEKIKAKVKNLHRFDSFAELYKALPLSDCGYTAGEKAAPADMDKYYSKEDQLKYGVVGIEIELMEGKRSSMVKLSRYISMLLRHKPEAAGITLDKNGWADVDELIRGICRTRYIDRKMLEKIVAEDEKQRYSFSSDKTRIRANQGHSVDVDVELEEKEPPEILWHGSAEQFGNSIDCSGILPKSRQYVHLSSDRETAVKVGSRHGAPIVYTVRSGKMFKDGYRFFLSANGVWLTKRVPVDYIERGAEKGSSIIGKA